ncbi:tetratricopeptide repeat protein [Fortiea sp. LEGE XX443]|uniref:tetratricopeptide repeat protein n=1 Tax=Fortiea sp. LEGE XX443 TaxID=1828611 RepID=UPI001881A4F6|nr:tetratricopeptide repeat protein [Fortiea sp. LEGE XX443]MBE9006604.1 tetratricopeptide repeat protein [Fortiea sp. LEGE XX443]
MNPPNKPKSLQDILKQRQQSGFVGREEQVNLFRQNLELPWGDDRQRFIFNVWGQGGVGKTTLLRQFRQIVEGAKIIPAYVDEGEKSVPEVMGRLAEDLEQQGHKLAQFTERYKVYRQKRQELETDPEAPQGFSAFVGKTVAKAGMGMAKQVPGAGAVFGLINEDAFATQAGEWTAYVAKKLTNKDEIRLVQEPVEVLTPLFLEDICKIAQKSGLGLFFDTYERSEEFLDSWLREILDGRHGEVPLNILIIIAGRQELDKNHWAFYEGLMFRFPLEPFTEAEAQQYLTRKGITNSRVIEVILRLSGNLPLLVATLAAETPSDPSQVGDPSGTAVERFLKWIDDPKRRQLAVDAALPLCLNRDVLAKLRGEEEADGLFSWLKEMPFIDERTDGWAYHDVVKTQMLRHKRLVSPQSWADLHGKLADYYDTLRNDLHLEEDKKQRDPLWQNYTLNVLYHGLCQSPQRSLPAALNEFLAAFKNQRSFAQRWAERMIQAGKDTDVAEIQLWGEQLANALKAYDKEQYEIAAEMLTALLSDTFIEVKCRAVALGLRGYVYFLSNKDSKALEDLNKAIKLAPEEAMYLSARGFTYQAMEHYQEALQDFDRAIELDPQYKQANAGRGLTYKSMERYEEALPDFNRAVELDPKYEGAIAQRGETYRLMKRYEEALPDFNRAIELNPKFDWAIAQRGETYRLMKRYQEALQNFNRAIELNPKSDWAIAQRGLTYQSMQRYQEALQNFDRAIELNPKSDWAIAQRGLTYQSMQRYQEALQNFDRAIELNPKSDWAIANRGETYRLMQRYQEALQDFDHAIELNPKSDWAIAQRGLTYQSMQRYQEALQDFDHAIELNPNLDGAIRERGETYRLMQRYQEALQDFDRAIELNPKSDWAIAQRGLTYQSMERYPEALQDFNRAIELNPQLDWGITNRGLIYKSMGLYQEALQDFNRAIELNPNLDGAITGRGDIYRLKHRYQEALQDFDLAIELNPKLDWAIAQRGLTYQSMERYQEALQDFDCAIELNPKLDWAIAGRGQTYQSMKRYQEALQDFNIAINLNIQNDWCLYRRALTYIAINQKNKSQADLALAINIAQQRYEKDAYNWQNVFNLAIYYLADEYTKPAEELYHHALFHCPLVELKFEAIQDLNELLTIFPNHVQAQGMRQLLQSSLT